MRRPSFQPATREVQGRCPACGGEALQPFFETRGAPTATTLLIPTRKEALACPRGDILLVLCATCGFIHNLRFDPRLTEYSERYEGTQAFSPTFDAYHRELARDLVERHDLAGRRVLEIGCGQGEFLELLCQEGAREGIGFDPAVRAERERAGAAAGIRYERAFYSEAWADVDADLYACKMTLEHIPDVGRFVAMLRKAIGERPQAVVFVQVPEVAHVLREAQFYDVMYEHCSYYTASSLRRLFARSGFEGLETRVTYGGQHLSLEARPGRAGSDDEPLDELRSLCADFAARCTEKAARWTRSLEEALAAGRRVVVWGSGSKATAFLTMLDVGDEIPAVVDINPNREGMYLAGCGHEIVSPEALRRLRPDLVVAVNPIYREEIAADLERLGVDAELETLSP